MKRTGKRGEGKWERVTWEEAYQTIAQRFNNIKRELGPESVIFCQGTGRDIGPYISRLAYSFGSPNRVIFGPLHGHACFRPKVTVLTATTGGHEVADCAEFVSDRYENPSWKTPKYIIIWGNNPIVSNPDLFLGHWVIECMKRGSEIIVVDPRKTWLATRAKIWMQIRPGTDAALALGMLNVIINEEAYDDPFVREWTYGFEELKKRVQDYPPDKVEEITWIPKEKIIEAARIYASSKPAAIQFGVAIEQSKECVPTIHAIIALSAITGNLDVPGGNVIRSRNFNLNAVIDRELEEIIKDRKNKKIGTGKYPLLDDWYMPAVGSEVIEQMLSDSPYPIKAAWIQTTNTFVWGC
jgi:anaerobic selenocysteine-containing dehydrogenase